MAQYDVMMSCGHEETVVLYGKTTERQRKIKYFEREGLCKECYKKKMREQDESEGLVFNISVLPYIDNENGCIQLSVWLSGNTKPHKDAIKSIGGYRWSTRESADDYYGFSTPPMCWNKVVDLENLNREIENAQKIGVNSINGDTGITSSINYKIAFGLQKEWKSKENEIATIPKPHVPKLLQGHSWNQKIYGRSGNRSIYPDGVKTNITDEEADEIKKYLEEKEEYRKKIDEIRNR